MFADPLIGVNLDPIVDFGTAWTFTDVFKTSRPWLSHAYNTVTNTETFSGGGQVHVNEQGWPTHLNAFENESGQRIEQRLSTLMFRDIGDKYPAGIYRAEWKGTGTVTWQFAARAVEQGVMDDGTNYALLNVTPRNTGISMRIESIDPSDPIRDVHVWMPDYQGHSFSGQVWSPGESFSPFHPAFLESLEPFSTLRFMEWTDTNRSTLESWSDRRLFDHARQRGENRGIAYEYIVQLANELDKDVWISIPYKADDDYVKSMATLFRDGLDPELKVFVEYSNEVWNGQFDTFNWITQKLPNGDESLRWSVTADEIVRDFDIWSDVFASQTSRLVRVVAGVTDAPQSTNRILQGMQGKFDAIAVGSYVRLTSANLAGFDGDSTVDEILDAAFENLHRRTLDRVGRHQELADAYSAVLDREIDLLVYEGGQLLLPESANAAYLPAIYEAQTDARMYDLYEELLRGLDELGVDVFGHFTHINKHTPTSTTGALQYQLDLIGNAPKYQALVDATQGKFFVPELSTQLYTVTEGVDSFAIVEFLLSDPSSQSIQLNLSIDDISASGDGVDYGSLQFSVDDGVTWAVGNRVVAPPETSRVFARVAIVDDNQIELDEAFRVSASISDGSSNASSIVTIKSEDVPDTTSDLVAYWSFDSHGSTTVHDVAPNGWVVDNGLLQGSAALIDQMLRLTSDGGVEVESSADINQRIVAKRTLALSFYANDSAKRQVVFEEGGGTRGMNIYIENGELVLGGWNISVAQSGWQGTWLKAPIVTGRWYHVALVLDAGPTIQSGAMVGYLNGVEFGRGEASQIWGRSDPIGIGVGHGQTRFESHPQTMLDAKGLDGGIENVRIYNRVLPSDAIAALAVIMSDPPLPVVEISVSDAMAREGDDLVFNVTLDKPSPVATTVQFLVGDLSAQPSDYDTTEVMQITIPPGSVAAQLRIKTVDDSNLENSESFQMVPNLVSGSAIVLRNGIGTILDNDEVDLVASVVASWTFDDILSGKVADVATSGSIADDGSVLPGAAIEPGWGMNGAMKFNGTGRIAIQSSIDINRRVVTQTTVSLWFYADETTSRQVLFEQGASTTGLALYIEAGKLIGGAWSQFAVAGGWKGVWLDTAVLPNRWNHVAVVLDSTSKSFSGFLNGLEFGRAIGNALISHTDPIGIGASNGGTRFQTGPVFASGASPFLGYIDEVSVYNSSLLPSQILSIASRADQFSVASPPILSTAVSRSSTSKADLNRDGAITAADALLVINVLLLNSASSKREYDANEDGIISAADALEVIYVMNRNDLDRRTKVFSGELQPLGGEVLSLKEQRQLDLRDRAIEELTDSARSKLF